MLDREACIVLNMISGIGYVKYSALSDEFGSPAMIFEQSAESLRRTPGIGAALADRIAECDCAQMLAGECELADKAGVGIITLYDEAYPDVLRHLYDPPLCLYVRGKLPPFPDNAVAVVGSRRMSGYGARMTRQITLEAVDAGFTIVSGLAFGVDTVAHQAAVDHHGVTVAVLGGGLMHIHPQENIPLARSIVESGGALVSEFPMNFPVSRSTFPRRNRIVAGLCAATIVTEAGVSSGALITARLALENGRDLFAVPGNVENPQSHGCHQLIKEGAAGLVENFADVQNGMGIGFLPGLRPGEEANEGEVPYNPDVPGDLSPEAQTVWNLLENREMSIDALVNESGFDTGTLLAVLMRLEMKLLVCHGADQIYKRNRG